MPETGPNPAYMFGLPPERAIEYLESKGLKPSDSYRDVMGAEHARTFTVARTTAEYAKASVLQDIRKYTQDALAEGKTFKQFAAELRPRLQKAGWWGAYDIINPKTGEVLRTVRLGSLSRLRTIYRENMVSAYARGRDEAIEAGKSRRPYGQYIAVLDDVTRHSHAELHGRVFALDDPFWAHFTPPIDYGCRCDKRALNDRDLEKKNLKVEDSKGKLKQVDSDVKDPETGKPFKTHAFRHGSTSTRVHPSFDFAPLQGRPAPPAGKFDPDIQKQYVQAQKEIQSAPAPAPKKAKPAASEAAAKKKLQKADAELAEALSAVGKLHRESYKYERAEYGKLLAAAEKKRDAILRRRETALKDVDPAARAAAAQRKKDWAGEPTLLEKMKNDPITPATEKDYKKRPEFQKVKGKARALTDVWEKTDWESKASQEAYAHYMEGKPLGAAGKEAVAAFRKALKPVKKNMTVYRGMHLAENSPQFAEILKMQPGSEYKGRQQLYTSSSAVHAANFAGRKWALEDRNFRSVMLEIRLPNGTKVMAANLDEMEYILPPESKFRVLEARHTGDGLKELGLPKNTSYLLLELDDGSPAPTAAQKAAAKKQADIEKKKKAEEEAKKKADAEKQKKLEAARKKAEEIKKKKAAEAAAKKKAEAEKKKKLEAARKKAEEIKKRYITRG